MREKNEKQEIESRVDTMGSSTDSPTATTVAPTAAAGKVAPLPWSVFDEGYPHHRCPGIEAAGNVLSVVVWGDGDDPDQGVQGRTAEDARANAEFIVRCVNAHEPLVNLVRDFIACDEENDLGVFANRMLVLVARGRELLAKE